MKTENVFVVGLVGGVSFMTEEVVLNVHEGMFVTSSSLIDPTKNLDSYMAGENAFNPDSKIFAATREEARLAKIFVDHNLQLFLNGASILNTTKLVTMIEFDDLRQSLVSNWVSEIADYLFSDLAIGKKGYLDLSFVVDTDKERISSFYEVLEEGDATYLIKKNYLHNPTIFDSKTLATTLLLEVPASFKGISVDKDFYKAYLVEALTKALYFVAKNSGKVQQEVFSS